MLPVLLKQRPFLFQTVPFHNVDHNFIDYQVLYNSVIIYLILTSSWKQKFSKEYFISLQVGNMERSFWTLTLEEWSLLAKLMWQLQKSRMNTRNFKSMNLPPSSLLLECCSLNPANEIDLNSFKSYISLFSLQSLQTRQYNKQASEPNDCIIWYMSGVSVSKISSQQSGITSLK